MIPANVWAADTAKIVEQTSMLCALDDAWVLQSRRCDELRCESERLHAGGQSAAPLIDQLATIASDCAAIEDVTLDTLERFAALLIVIASRG